MTTPESRPCRHWGGTPGGILAPGWPVHALTACGG